MQGNSILKRIKRHVIAPMHTFFVATGPGLKKICLNELLSLPLSQPNPISVDGGIQFQGFLHDCYLANFHLRTANRILMRIDHFKADNFSQLEKNISKFPWELFLFCNQDIQINVTTKHSKLYHKQAIAQRFKTFINKRLVSESDLFLETPVSQTLFIRAVDNNFTVSLDSSGDLLYKRGIKKYGAKAPLRESIAAAAILLSGYKEGEIVIDPMCGAGTFSLEAAMISANIPAGWFRDFAFTKWPCFQQGRLKHIKRQAKKQIVDFENKNSLVFASDKNIQNVKTLETIIKEYNLSKIIETNHLDFFDFNPKNFTDKKGLIVINPPYGIRIGNKKESYFIFDQICKKLKKDYKGWRFAIIEPEKNFAKKAEFKAFFHPFFHGGLNLNFLFGRLD